MATVHDSYASDWTFVDMAARFGAMPVARVRSNPAPGTATERDVLALDDHKDRLCELIDGVLLEKTMGSLESSIAIELAMLIGSFAKDHKLGRVLGADGMLRLAPRLVYIPDVSFISWKRWRNPAAKKSRIWRIVPDLAVEVISRGNTKEEMDTKLQNYFRKGAREVWYVYPQKEEFHVYTSVKEMNAYGRKATFSTSQVLPGFSLHIGQFFAATETE